MRFPCVASTFPHWRAWRLPSELNAMTHVSFRSTAVVRCATSLAGVVRAAAAHVAGGRFVVLWVGLSTAIAVFTALDTSQAHAGCGSYIHFRGSRMAGVDSDRGHARPAAELSRHRVSESNSWFWVAMGNLLGGRHSTPTESPDCPCRGPACQRQPQLPTVPVVTLVGWGTTEALVPAERTMESPTIGRCGFGFEIAQAINRPSAIFRPPR